MSNLIKRDKKKRLLVEKLEAKRLAYISMRNNLELPLQVRHYFMQKLNQLPRNSSKVRVKNRCILTGRGGSVSRLFKLSRIKIRELAGKGSLPGVTKSSW